MVIKILGERSTPAYRVAEALIKRMGHAVYDKTYFYCDLSVAPLLTTKLSDWELLEPIKGTLIFHPSPLPHGRGPSSIKWAYKRGEPITAATWFWANNKLDGGDICEMEIIAIDYSLAPKEYYALHVLPALERTLERCLISIARGIIKRIPQVDAYASYDSKL
ncbi:MAG: formyltransferase family protein [Bacteroidales bacterium]